MADTKERWFEGLQTAKLRGIVGATGIFGLFPLSLSPLIVSSAQNDGMTGLMAGILATSLLLGVSVSAIGLGAISDRFSLRHVFRAGIVLVLALQAILAINPNLAFPVICALWFVSGIGSGCGIVVGDIILAKTRNPMMMAGIGLAVTSILMLCVFPLGTFLIEAIGSLTITLLCIGSALASYSLLKGIDLDKLRLDGEVAETDKTKFSLPIIALLISFLFFWTRDGMIWSFSANKAEGLGFEPTSVGLILGFAGACGVAGSAAAAWTARSGAVQRKTMVVFAILAATVAWLWTFDVSPTQFAVAQLSYNALQLFTYPLLLGFAAQLDRSGRLAAIAGGTTLLGAAIGPIASGFVTEEWGSTGLITGVAIVNVISIAALVIATARKNLMMPKTAPVAQT